MCKNHLQPKDELFARVENLYGRFQLCEEILRGSTRWVNWQAIEEVAQQDAQSLIRSLLEENLFDIARKYSRILNLNDLALEIEESYLLNLLRDKGDHSAALSTLIRLGSDAVPIAELLLQKVTGTKVKLFLVQYLLTNQVGAFF